MANKHIKVWKILLFGFVLFIAWQVFLFAVSLVLRAENPMTFTSTGIIVMFLMGVTAYFLGRATRISNSTEALTYALAWTILFVILQLAITIPNGTTAIVFGNWANYLVYLGVFGGPLFTLIKKKPATAT
ncbi:MAG: hypothetical protein V1895_02530 [Parcubacteria group bacterium]